MAKKVLIISTSLRGGSNSEILANECAEGAKEAGHDVELLSLKGKDIKYCIGCLSCQRTGIFTAQAVCSTIAELQLQKSRRKTMQEEVTQKTIALVFKSSRLTADVLKKAMKMYLERRKAGQQATHGKMSVKKLVGQGMGASSIEVTDNNIKSFERVTRKYNVDFAVKKDKTVEPPKYMVFFKGKDADVITQAFKEFVKVNEKKRGKVSVKEKLAEFRELLGKDKNRERAKGTPKRQGAVVMSKIIDGIAKDLKAISRNAEG